MTYLTTIGVFDRRSLSLTRQSVKPKPEYIFTVFEKLQSLLETNISYLRYDIWA